MDSLSCRYERGYERSTQELVNLIKALQRAGVNVDALLREVEKERHNNVLEIIQTQPAFSSLLDAARHWKGSYDNLKEEEAEWNEMLWQECCGEDDFADEPLYGGLSDDWEEYLDMIHYDK